MEQTDIVSSNTEMESMETAAEESDVNKQTVESLEIATSVKSEEMGDVGTGCVSEVTVAEANEGMDEDAAISTSVSEMTDTSSSSSCVDPSIRIQMLSHLAMSDAHFKHQQLGEADLTLEEKIMIAQELLDTSKVKFLARFGNYLELNDVEYFRDSRDVYEIDFYCKQIIKRKTGNFSRNVVKNRRYEAMKELMEQGDYFSEDEMKFRDPYLYDQMVGQYLTDDEIKQKVDKSDLTFSSILIKHMDIIDENKRFQEDKDVEEGQMEEEEESDEDEAKVDLAKPEKKDPFNPEEEDEESNKPKIPEERRQELKEEFLTIMQERFMSGQDKQFDYSKVDRNEGYDNLTLINHDAEEKYFDDEDSDSVHSNSNL